jgi:hypothetical protein
MGPVIRAAGAVLVGALALALLQAMSPPRTREVYDPRDYGIVGRKGCILPTTPPHLTAIAIPTVSREAAESAAARLGLVGYWEGDLFVCPILDQAIVWVVGPRLPHGVRVSSVVPQPLAHREYAPQDRTLPLGVWPVGRPIKAVGDTQRSLRILSVFAIVPSADSVAQVWPPPHSQGESVPLLSFRPPVALEPFSAWSWTAGAGGWSGKVTLLEPDRGDGLAARWLDGGARWIGVELAVGNIENTAAWFAEHGVKVHRLDDLSVWVEASPGRDFVVVFRQLAGS